MHWVTDAGHLVHGGGADHHAASAGSCGRSRACATSARTSGRRSSARRSPASTSARTGSASTRRPTTTRRSTAIEEVVDGYPGLYRDVADLPQRADRGGADRRRASRSSCASSGRPRDVMRDKADEVRSMLARHRRRRRRARRARRPTCPQIEVEVDLAKAAGGTASSPATCAGPPPPCVAGEEVGDIFQRRQGLRRGRLEHARRPAQRRRHRQPADRHADAAARCRWATSPTSTIAPTPERHRARDESRAIDVGAERRRAATSARSSPTSRRSSRASSFPLGYHAEVLGEYAGAAGRAAAGCSASRIVAAIGIFLLLQASSAAGGWRRSPSSPCRWRWSAGVLAAYVAGGVISLGSLVGFFTVFGIAARNGIMLINHFQHLEQQEGDDVRSGARPARRRGAALADPDDVARHRPRARAAGGRRRHRPATRSSTRWPS